MVGDQTKLLKYLAVWVVTSVLLVVASEIFKGMVVLGNASLPKGFSAVFAGFVISALFYLTPVAIKKLEIRVKDERLMLGVNFAVAVVGIWIIKRLSVLTGFGVKNILFVILVAALVSIVSFAVEKYSSALLGKSK